MELIDRDALHQTFMKWFKKEMLNDEKISKTISWADALLREEPEVDAVPVVRCKDCKYYCLMPNGCNGDCDRQYASFNPWDFCSYGERRKGNETD